MWLLCFKEKRLDPIDYKSGIWYDALKNAQCCYEIFLPVKWPMLLNILHCKYWHRETSDNQICNRQGEIKIFCWSADLPVNFEREYNLEIILLMILKNLFCSILTNKLPVIVTRIINPAIKATNISHMLFKWYYLIKTFMERVNP